MGEAVSLIEKRLRLGRAAHPLWVLLVAATLPGVGQVVNRAPTRGLVFVFYTLLLGIVTFNLTTPEHSFMGRYSGGIFIYAVSILDAYKWASHRRHRANSGGAG